MNGWNKKKKRKGETLFLFRNAPERQHSKDSELTDVVHHGSIRSPPPPPPFLFSFLISSDVSPPPPALFFFFFLSLVFFLPALKFTNNVLVTYFSPNSFPPSVFRAGHALSGRGEKYWGGRQEERKSHAWQALHNTPRRWGYVQQEPAFHVGLTTTEVHPNSSELTACHCRFSLANKHITLPLKVFAGEMVEESTIGGFGTHSHKNYIR